MSSNRPWRSTPDQRSVSITEPQTGAAEQAERLGAAAVFGLAGGGFGGMECGLVGSVLFLFGCAGEGLDRFDLV
jgi:hypothetical protein